MDYFYLFIDIILHLDKHLGILIADYGSWIYLILFIVIFCETGLIVTPFLPGDSLLFVAGAFAANGQLDVTSLMLLIMVAAFIGDNLNYSVGRFAGVKLFSNPQSRLFKRQHLDETHAFFERHGGKTLVVARFVPIVRTFAPFVAGMSSMPYRRFLCMSVLGTSLWVGLLVPAGYLLGNLPFFKKNLSLIIMAIIVISLLPVLLKAFSSFRKSRQSLA